MFYVQQRIYNLILNYQFNFSKMVFEVINFSLSICVAHSLQKISLMFNSTILNIQNIILSMQLINYFK